VAEAEDLYALQVVGADEEKGYSRAIGPVDPERIIEYHTESGGPDPPTEPRRDPTDSRGRS
jgi:hypothetical protein